MRSGYWALGRFVRGTLLQLSQEQEDADTASEGCQGAAHWSHWHSEGSAPTMQQHKEVTEGSLPSP